MRLSLVVALLCLPIYASASKRTVYVVGVHESALAQIFSRPNVDCILFGGTDSATSLAPGDPSVIRSVKATLGQASDPRNLVLGPSCDADRSELVITWVVLSQSGLVYKIDHDEPTHIPLIKDLATNSSPGERFDYLADTVETDGQYAASITPCRGQCKSYHRVWFARNFRGAAHGFRELVAGAEPTGDAVSQENDYLSAAIDAYKNSSTKTVRAFGLCKKASVQYTGNEWLFTCNGVKVPLEKVTKTLNVKAPGSCQKKIEINSGTAKLLADDLWVSLQDDDPTFRFIVGSGCSGQIDAAIERDVISASLLVLQPSPNANGSPVSVTDPSRLRDTIWVTRVTNYVATQAKTYSLIVDDAYGYPYELQVVSSTGVQCASQRNKQIQCEIKTPAVYSVDVAVMVPFRLLP